MTQLPPRLLAGYTDFKSGHFRSEQEQYELLADKGQKPEIMLIGCCDSRAAPTTIFSARPGEMFVVRNVANLVPNSSGQPDGIHGTAAALEFAVNALKVKHIVVMGHGRCGGVAAHLTEDMEPLSESNYIGEWTSQLEPANQEDNIAAINRPDLDRQGQLERSSIIQSIKNLMSYPCISKRVESGDLELHGAWFDISLGDLEYYDLDEKTFKSVNA